MDDGINVTYPVSETICRTSGLNRSHRYIFQNSCQFFCLIFCPPVLNLGSIISSNDAVHEDAKTTRRTGNWKEKMAMVSNASWPEEHPARGSPGRYQENEMYLASDREESKEQRTLEIPCHQALLQASTELSWFILYLPLIKVHVQKSAASKCLQ